MRRLRCLRRDEGLHLEAHRLNGLDLLVQSTDDQFRILGLHRCAQCRIMGQALLYLSALFGGQGPQHVFTGQFIQAVVHAMHSRKAARLRLIQALTVPSGVLSFCAISLWE